MLKSLSRPMKWAIGPALVAIAILGSPVSANSPYVACVQNQLNELGHDAGPADGIIGAKTNSALRSFRQSQTSEARAAYDKLPRLSRRAAVGWCREIAAFNQVTLPLMPSRSRPPFVTADDMDPRVRRELNLVYSKAVQHLANEYGVRLASVPVIVASRDEREWRNLVRSVASHDEVSSEALTRVSQRECNSESRLGASSFRDHLTFCWPKFDVDNQSRFDRWQNQLELAMLHEMVHQMQRELSYDKVPHFVQRGTEERRRMGPPWMIEGTAEAIEWKYGDQELGIDNISLYQARERAREAGINLTQIRAEGNVRSNEAYDASYFAAAALVERFGQQSLIDYWRAVGETDNWFVAFETVYGMTVSEYETMYDQFIADEDAVFTFAYGDSAGDGRGNR